ncbi:MAG: O-acetyl-ADP-ribose deacetylase [Candidatus Omnitrophica bacterium]|nr:O-acetyl-ADP-ribose deacetylase [Candidatus Omnitrophota bacterium]
MITIKLGDITKEEIGAIVNAANKGLRGGGGVDEAIHRAAGPSVMEECREIGRCNTGDAVITGAGLLKAKNVIHAVGPVWRGGEKGEAGQLRSCYEKSFEVALKNGIETIALPAISTGVYGYPIEEAADIALRTGKRFEDRFREIRYVCFSDRDFRIYKETLDRLSET